MLIRGNFHLNSETALLCVVWKSLLAQSRRLCTSHRDVEPTFWNSFDSSRFEQVSCFQKEYRCNNLLNSRCYVRLYGKIYLLNHHRSLCIFRENRYWQGRFARPPWYTLNFRQSSLKKKEKTMRNQMIPKAKKIMRIMPVNSGPKSNWKRAWGNNNNRNKLIR